MFRAGLPGKQDHFFGAAALRIGIRDQLQPGALRVHRPKSAASRPACSSAVRTMCAFSNMASVLWPTQRPAPEFVHATQIPALYHGILLPVTVLFPQRPWGRNLLSCGRRTASGEEDNVIRIGAIGPMTGGSAIYGEGAQNAIEMAVEEINADDSSPYTIEIVNGGEIADDAQDARQAMNAYNLVMADNPEALVGSFFSTVTLPIAEQAAVDSMLLVATGATNVDVTVGRPTVFRDCFIDPYQGRMAALFVQSEGYSQVAVIYANDDDYSNGLKDAFIPT